MAGEIFTNKSTYKKGYTWNWGMYDPNGSIETPKIPKKRTLPYGQKGKIIERCLKEKTGQCLDVSEIAKATGLKRDASLHSLVAWLSNKNILERTQPGRYRFKSSSES